MTDKELLERAARAAGYNFDGNLKHDRYSSNIWDPLFDDGDAFRLMVALGISPKFDGYADMATQDELSKTRRAIVRAAAEMAG
ncbi:hypothetical protein R3F64_01300 [Halomonas sp. 5021]|uniref:hypothetical protein n=1 Tax=Halomonas sp. 5021 TaxID=3082156 RepID=UPI002FC9F3B6